MKKSHKGQINSKPEPLTYSVYRRKRLTRAKEEAVKYRGIVPLAELEKRAILDAMRKTDGNRLVAATALGISERTIYRKIDQHKLDIAPKQKRPRWI